METFLEKAACVHHWMCEPPDQKWSKGTCKFCGEERLFLNWMHFPYERDGWYDPLDLLDTELT